MIKIKGNYSSRLKPMGPISWCKFELDIEWKKDM
jgi:hypothetical protein